MLTAPVHDGDTYVLVASKGGTTAIPRGISICSRTPTWS